MQLHDLATGPLSPTVAMIFAALGSLMGILLVTRARQRTGIRRLRLVAYATLAVALAVVWLPALVAVLALRVDGSVLRVAAEPLGISLGVATGATALALLPICWGRPGLVRQVLAGLAFVAGIGGTGWYVGRALTTGEPIVAQLTSTGIAVAIAGVAGFGLAGALAATRTLRMAIANAALLGVALAGVYHVAAAALRLQPAPGGPIPADEVVGLVPLQIGLPGVIATATLLAMVGFFTLGTATGRDLRLIFEPAASAEQIDPRIIEQVRTRVALSSTAYTPVPGVAEVWAQHEPTVAVHALRLTQGIADAFVRPLPGDAVEATAQLELIAELELATDPDLFAEPEPTPELELTVTADPTVTPDSTVMAEATAGAAVAWRAVPSWGLPTSQWPAPARNEPGVATRTPRPSQINSRYGPLPTHPDHPVSPAPREPVAVADPAAWAARLRAASLEGADGNGEPIVNDFDAGSPLPKRNARPISRP
jgi:hypothetical protein